MMSKILMNVTLFHTKIIVNSYTALTLPFYAAYQKPWRQLKLSNLMRAQKMLDKSGETIWVRKGPTFKNPNLACSTYLEAFSNIDRSRQSVGIRNVLEEKVDYDENGNPVIIDGKILKKIVLADNYRWMTVAEVLEKVDGIARGLHELGVRKGDRVIIYAETQPNWFFCSLAVGKLNACTVTLYSNLGESGVIYGVNQTKAQYVITTEDLKDKLLGYLEKVPHVKNIVYMKNASKNGKANIPIPDSVTVRSLEEIEADGAKAGHIKFELPDPNETALIMYTSGTTSLPKAVMITHHQLMSNIKSMIVTAEDNMFNLDDLSLASFLPLSHIFGYVFNIFMFITGAKIGFATPFTLLNSSPAHVPGQTGDLKLIKPNLMIVVPLVLERFQKEIYAQLNKRSFLAAPLFTYFMDYKIRWLSRGFDTPLLNYLVCRKIKEQFGGRLQMIGVGGAPLHTQIQSFSRAALDVKVINAYGTTETCAGAYMQHIDDLTIGNCGVPFENVKAKLVDWPEGGYTTNDKPNPRGELAIGGDIVANGYYEMPEETEEAFKVDSEGTRWFFTGDVGEIDPTSGRIRIIDRKKDLAKLANGEYISLGKVESGLRSSRYIENICVCTDMYSNDLVALISPNRKVLKELAKSLNKGHMSNKEMCQDEEITQIVLDSINQTGKRAELKEKEIPIRVTLTAEEWTPDNNLLTAAFKLKRKHVNEFYKKDIQRMFDSIKQTR